MQNKGFVKVFALLLTLVCVFYLSFSFATSYQAKKIEEVRVAQGEDAAEHYEDSISKNPVWLWAYSYRDCREMEISLGLDLKGGMNVVLEVSVPDVIKALAGHKTDVAFNQAVENAAKQAENSQSDFITLFIQEYHKLAPGSNLASLFATQQLKGKVNTQSTDREVERVLRDEVKAAVDNSFNVLRTRIDRFGVAQPNIQTLEDKMGRIMVELPGVKEPERVRKLLQGSANLEFWETYFASEVYTYLVALDSRLAAVQAGEQADSAQVAPADTAAVADTVKADVKSNLAKALKSGAADKKTNTAADEEEFRKKHPLMGALQISQANYNCVVGYAGKRDTAQVNRCIESALAKEILPSDLKLMWGVKPIEGQGGVDVFELYAIRSTERNGRAPLEGDVVTQAKDDYDRMGQPQVSMTMNSDGARRWAALTKKNIKRCVAIVLDGYVYSAPTVQNEITGGVSAITGRFSVEDTRDLANVLNTGKMPAPAKIVNEEVVGPQLGQESIEQGVMSFAIAFILLMIYMCAMYGLIPGMVANCALILNFFFTLGVLTSFQAALTMSGIAGMVLSLGMAVDANVLIYERTKEELRAGKSVRQAIADGYSNAFSAIFDSNLTSVITGIILYNFGTGPIRGFATTLIIGILVSFFTAVFLTRVVYEFFLNKDKWLGLTFTTSLSKKFLRDTSYKFMSAYKRSFIVFGILLVVSIGSMFVRGWSEGIDFTGGRNFKVQFEQPVEPETVRGLLQNKFGDANVQVIAIGGDHKTVRISTNYRINEDGVEVDSEIEETIYKTLKDGKLLSEGLTLEHFIDREAIDGGSIIGSAKVGPSMAEDITYGAIVSVVLALIAIFLYILIRFRNVAFSVGAVTALTADTLIILGIYSLCWGWMPFSLEIDQTFIGAVLTAIGYSINDKVVVFDRIREFLGLYPKRDRQRLFNESLNTTLARTINTSLTTLVVLLCIFVFGGDSIRSFAFAMILGVVVGTCSSIFLAAPVAFITMGRRIKETAEEA